MLKYANTVKILCVSRAQGKSEQSILHHFGLHVVSLGENSFSFSVFVFLFCLPSTEESRLQRNVTTSRPSYCELQKRRGCNNDSRRLSFLWSVNLLKFEVWCFIQGADRRVGVKSSQLMGPYWRTGRNLWHRLSDKNEVERPERLCYCSRRSYMTQEWTQSSISLLSGQISALVALLELTPPPRGLGSKASGSHDEDIWDVALIWHRRGKTPAKRESSSRSKEGFDPRVASLWSSWSNKQQGVNPFHPFL